MSLYESIPRWIIETPNHLKTQEISNEAVDMRPYSLVYVPDRFKTQNMCDENVRNKPFLLDFDQIILRPKRCARRPWT